MTQKAWKGSFSCLSTYVKSQREQYGKNLLLLDNGDILQGQPTVYYYNYMDTVSEHVCASMMNYLGYDAGNMGNHDVETGHKVYDRWIRECKFPILGANIIQTSTDKSYLPPYAVFNRNGVKVVVLGMITPAIPQWLSENLWSGLHFADMEQTARKWVKIIREQEHPDILVGLFHSGLDSPLNVKSEYIENASELIARNVPGFDVVFAGHDHKKANVKIRNVAGDSVLVIDPANNADNVASVDIDIQKKGNLITKKTVLGKLIPLTSYQPDEDFNTAFASQFNAVQTFVSRKVGTFTQGISTRDAYFGPSAFIDFIHCMQLNITGADISFAAPLSFDASIKQGDLFISDMFQLYKFENMLYVMKFTGREIKNYLELSYYYWTNQMHSPSDHLLLLKPGKSAEENNALRYFSFNFDSAAGIRYTVDVRKPKGYKINIISMSDGRPFDMNKTYKVAVNSYRGNGGGDLLTLGAGIKKSELHKRILNATDTDLRYLLMQYIQRKGVLSPKPRNEWKFIPEDWTIPASKRDYQLLFNEKQ